MFGDYVDAVVVGSGAGGGVVANVLAQAGMKTVILEMGEWACRSNDDEDFLAGQRSCILTQGPGRDGTRTRKAHFFDNGNNGVVNPNNAAVVGSGTVTYGAMAWRFMPEDFRLKSVYGELPGSSLADWPISYNDMEPYYERAEWEIGVAGDDTTNPFAGPRKRPRPMPAFPYTKQDLVIKAACLKLGLHPFPPPALRNSIPYNGRSACLHERACVGYACPIDAKNGSQNTVIPKALKTGNCELWTRCIVSRVLTDSHGRAIGVEFFDGNDQKRVLHSKIVVLSAAASGTARILLNSASDRFPTGLGNSSDQVGRNAIDHWYVESTGYMDEPVYSSDGPGTGIAVCDFSHHNPGFIGGGVIHTDFSFLPYQHAENVLHGGWGLVQKRKVRDTFQRFTRLCGPIQEIPMAGARIVLSDKRDYWGIPLVKGLSVERNPNDAKAAYFLHLQAAKILEAAGAKGVSFPDKKWYLEQKHWMSGQRGQHQAGTCRMGNDPKTSVCDSWGRLHDVENVYVADGSLHVSNGGFNPALTIMALAYRVGDGIINQWKKG